VENAEVHIDVLRLKEAEPEAPPPKMMLSSPRSLLEECISVTQGEEFVGAYSCWVDATTSVERAAGDLISDEGAVRAKSGEDASMTRADRRIVKKVQKKECRIRSECGVQDDPSVRGDFRVW
jgi:hypothetical protein